MRRHNALSFDERVAVEKWTTEHYDFLRDTHQPQWGLQATADLGFEITSSNILPFRDKHFPELIRKKRIPEEPSAPMSFEVRLAIAEKKIAVIEARMGDNLFLPPSK